MIKGYVFTPLENAVRAHSESVGDILKKHREQLKKARETYNEQAFCDYKSRAIESARERIVAADKKLSEEFKIAASRLRGELASYSNRHVDSGLLDNLRILKEFGLKMDKAEVESFVKQAAGNLTALRIIEAIATDSGFTLKYTSAADFQKDIDMLLSLACVPMLTAPSEYLTEAKEVMPDDIAWGGGRPSVNRLLIQDSLRRSFLNEHIPEMITRWSHSILPTIEEIETTVAAKLRMHGSKPTPDEEAAAVREAHLEAVETAAQAVEIAAVADFSASQDDKAARYNAIISHYK